MYSTGWETAISLQLLPVKLQDSPPLLDMVNSTVMPLRLQPPCASILLTWGKGGFAGLCLSQDS